MEDNRIFKFLIGLNVEFDEVRDRIIGRQAHFRPLEKSFLKFGGKKAADL